MKHIQLWSKIDSAIWGNHMTKVLAFITGAAVLLMMVISGTISFYTVLYGYRLYYKETFNRSILVNSDFATVFTCTQSFAPLIENVVPFESWYLFANAEIPWDESFQNRKSDELCLLGVNNKSTIATIDGDRLNFDKKGEVLVPSYFVSNNGKKLSTYDLLGKQLIIWGNDEQPSISLTIVGIYDKSEMCTVTMGPNSVFASFDTVELCSKTLYPEGRIAIYEEGVLENQSKKSQTIIIAKNPQDKAEILSLLSKESLDASSVMEIYPLEIGFVFILCFIFYGGCFVALYLFQRNTVKNLLDKQSSGAFLLYLLGEDFAGITKMYNIHYLCLFILAFAFALVISLPFLAFIESSLFQDLFIINAFNPLVLLQFIAFVVVVMLTIKRYIRSSIEQESFGNENESFYH